MKLIALICPVLVALLAAPARAATLTVTSTGDGGAGSLREALAVAESDPQPDVIAFAVEGTVALGRPLPALATAVTVRGPGARRLALTRAPSAADPFRVLTVAARGDVTIEGLTLSGGWIADPSLGEGGGVLNRGVLVLRDVVVRDNAIDAGPGIAVGGGIANAGVLTLERTEVRGNVARAPSGSASGGGIHTWGTLTLEDSTVAANALATPEDHRGSGGGIGQSGGTATLRRSTVAGNDGLGIRNATAALALENSTVSGNAAGGVGVLAGHTSIRSSTLRGGGGAAVAALPVDIRGDVEVTSTILDGAGEPACGADYQVTFRSHGDNLASDASCGFLTAPGDQRERDPQLGPLGDNGGWTMTHAIGASSPALDHGRADGLATDQRGRPRAVPAGSGDDLTRDGADVGAFELSAGLLPASESAPRGADDRPPAVPAAPPATPVRARRGTAAIAVASFRRDRRRGLARLRVRVSGPGRIVLDGAGVRRVAARAARAGTAVLRVTPVAAARRRLARRGAATVRVRLRFAAEGGQSATARRAIRLQREL